MDRNNTIVGISQERIEKRILLIRGLKVMLDRDLAELYGVETRVLNQAVRRNIKRFPHDFAFTLTRPEIRNLSQIVISSKIKHAPNVFVFTEQGVAMLSSILKSERAIRINIQIIRAFTKLRQILAAHKDILRKIEQHDQQIGSIFETLRQMLNPRELEKRKIGFRP